MKTIKKNDLSDVINIHNKAFIDFFMTKLGKRYLLKYYSIVLEYDESLALVFEDELHNISGFAVGFKEPSKFYKFFKQYKISILISTLFSVIKSPSLIMKIINNYFRVNSNSAISSCEENVIELSSIAVIPDSKGVGSKLLKSFIESSWELGCSQIKLTTDALNNDIVNNFYNKHGFKLAKKEQRQNRVMNHYILEKD